MRCRLLEAIHGTRGPSCIWRAAPEVVVAPVAVERRPPVRRAPAEREMREVPVKVEQVRTVEADTLPRLRRLGALAEQTAGDLEPFPGPHLTEGRRARAPVGGHATQVVLRVEAPTARGDAPVAINHGGVEQRGARG